MAGYVFFPPADATQDSIWDYTERVWGTEQAKTYIRGLHHHLQTLADKKAFWHQLPDSLVIPPDLRLHAYFSRYEHHYIFFRELPDNLIGIMSIQHTSMNLPVRLVQDLQKISQN